MLKTMEWHIETLPGSGIWTGSADPKKMTAIKGTSLLGGMRFWTEALLRSFGHKVCDCVQSKEVFDKKEQGKVCAACHSFGCTGLSRAFSLRVMPENMQENGETATVKVTPLGQDSPKTTGMDKQKDPKYSLAYGWQGRLTLAMSCRRPLSWPPVPNGEQGPVMLPPEVLLATLLMLEYGALGAHDQYGCGLVHLLDRDALLPKLQDCALPQDDSYASKEGYADLRDFFFFKGRLDQQKLERQSNCTITSKGVSASHAATVRVRRLLRDSLRGQGGDTTVRHWLCGTWEPEATGSHISLGVSAGTLYGWGWLPRAGIPGLSGSHWPSLREKALAAVHASLQSVCPDLRWKEFASAREAAAPKDWRAYVTEMIAQPWRDA